MNLKFGGHGSYYSNLKTSGGRFRGLRAIVPLIAKFKCQTSYSFWGTAAPDPLLQRFITGFSLLSENPTFIPWCLVNFCAVLNSYFRYWNWMFHLLCQIVKPGCFHPQFPQAFWLEEGVTGKTSCLNIFLDGEVLIFWPIATNRIMKEVKRLNSWLVNLDWCVIWRGKSFLLLSQWNLNYLAR